MIMKKTQLPETLPLTEAALPLAMAMDNLCLSQDASRLSPVSRTKWLHKVLRKAPVDVPTVPVVSKAIGWKMCDSEMFLYLAFFLTSAAFAPAPGAKEHGIKLESAKVSTMVASQMRYQPSYHWKRVP